MAKVIQYRAALFNRIVRYSNDNTRQFWTTAQVRIHFEEGGRGYLIFYDPDRTPDATNVAHSAGDTPLFFIPQRYYAAHLDLLRNEDPIYVVDDEDDWRFGSLRTTREDVGDGE